MSALRVIAGKARGRKLRSVPGNITRPITDRARESLFNILAVDVPGSSWLDLFAGTGSVGIEALSRGAAFVRFVDKAYQAIETVRANLRSTGLEQGSEVLRADAFSLLERPADRSFDYVFIAPPQYKGSWRRALASLEAHPDWLAQNAWVIVQIDPVEYETLALARLSEFDQRRYGSTLFVFFETYN
ncbi:MAG: 16S rRNA (guanine(966)-N(2))-methyltransferase RsmD [Anaerolineales bacterium]|nr:16S rRNA (guanine(966)-N(2))-methyltransferase RsmD [Anaerolineales bacterium]